MKVMHFLALGRYGGIETLMREYAHYSNHDNIFVFVWGGGEVYEDLKAEGVKTIVLNERNGSTIRIVKRLIKLCVNERIDVIVTHNNSPQFRMLVIWLRLFHPSIKTIAYAHTYGHGIVKYNTHIKNILSKPLNTIGFRSANAVIAISKSVKDSLIKLVHVPPSKISVIYNGVNLDRFEPRKNLEIYDSVKIIFVGRIIKEKGVQNILEVFSLLRDLENWQLSIVGDGPYRKELEHISYLMHLTERVQFLGERDDIPQLLKCQDIFIHMPEYEEGFGITVIEAMAAGLLCICKKTGGIPEIIEDGVSGILVDTNEDLTNILKTILKNMDNEKTMNQIVRMKEKAIERSNSFNIKKFVNSLDEIIEGMIK